MKHVVWLGLISLSIAATLSACRQSDTVSAQAKPVRLETQRDRVSYMVGLDLAQQLTPIKDEVDLDIAFAALQSKLAGKPVLLADTEVDTVRHDFTRHLREKREAEQKTLVEKNRKAGEAFLAENGTKSDVRTTASGLQYQILQPGKGPTPTATDTVRVHYVGKLLDGSVFDDSYARDHPVEVVLNQVMPGWKEGLALMSVGGKYRFWIPGKLAYGENGKPGEIEPNSTLTFDIELLEIAGQPLSQTD